MTNTPINNFTRVEAFGWPTSRTRIQSNEQSSEYNPLLSMSGSGVGQSSENRVLLLANHCPYTLSYLSARDLAILAQTSNGATVAASNEVNQQLIRRNVMPNNENKFQVLDHEQNIELFMKQIKHFETENEPFYQQLLQLLNNDCLNNGYLNLSGNEIGDEVARSIAFALNNNTNISVLNLENNQIGDEGARAIAFALNNNTNLHALHLDNNQIGDEGARAIAFALNNNTNLRALHLENNQIEDEGAKTDIEKALLRNKKNHSMTPNFRESISQTYTSINFEIWWALRQIMI